MAAGKERLVWRADTSSGAFVTQELGRRYGLRPSRAPECPMVLVGKRCRWSRCGFACVCERYRHALFDHGRMWIGPRGQHVLTGEPYHFVAATLETWLEEMRALGLVLRAEISLDSPWNPGHTTLVLVEAEGA